jgi:hypothetical protein
VASADIEDTPSVAEAKAKILQWMESNLNWTERCVPSASDSASRSFHRFSIHHSDYEKLNLHEFQAGVVSFQGYVGTQYTGTLPREGDLLYAVGGLRVSGWTLYRVNDTVSNVDVSICPGWRDEFVFMRDVNFIFSNPPAAIEFGLEPVLKHMIDNDIVGVRNRYSTKRRDRIMEKTNGGMPLLYHAVYGSPDVSCFRYLMSLPNIHCVIRGAVDEGGNLIHWCAFSFRYFSLGALEVVLRHAQAPEINDLNSDGLTPLCLLCIITKMPIDMRLKKLEMLLAYGADPLAGKFLPIEMLRKASSKQEQDKPEFKQMVNLLRKHGGF